MKVTMEVERPQDVRVTLTCTMTVGQWELMDKSLSKALDQPGHWHSDVASLRNAIRNAKNQITGKVEGGPLIKEG